MVNSSKCQDVAHELKTVLSFTFFKTYPAWTIDLPLLKKVLAHSSFVYVSEGECVFSEMAMSWRRLQNKHYLETFSCPFRSDKADYANEWTQDA